MYGNEYANTRHNIGFDVVFAFAQKHGGVFKEGRLAQVAEVKFKGKPIYLHLSHYLYEPERQSF